jgi:hypothetical protein
VAEGGGAAVPVGRGGSVVRVTPQAARKKKEKEREKEKERMRFISPFGGEESPA